MTIQKNIKKMAVIASVALTSLSPNLAHSSKDILFDGSIDAHCAFGSSTSGKIGLSTDAKTLSSELAGGSSATLQVIATQAGQLILSAPVLEKKPNNFNEANAIVQILVKEEGSTAEQVWSTAEVTQNFSIASDNKYIIDARIVNTSNFIPGDYQIKTIATCAADSITS